MRHNFSENPAEKKMFDSLEKQETEIFSNLSNIEIVLKEGSEERLKEDDFSDIYGKEIIEKDRIILAAVKRRFGRDLEHLSHEEIEKVEQKKQWSEALEIIITQHGGECGWFGGDASLVRTTEYDDIMNGVDGVLEFAPEGEAAKGGAVKQRKEKVRRVVLAVDASMNPAFENVRRKIDRNLEHLIGKGDELKVKYFASAVDGFRGEIKMVVPVVIGVDGKNANRLIGLFADMIKLGNSKTKERSVLERHKELLNKAIEHPSQKAFLEEIRLQLESYLSFLEAAPGRKAELYKEEILSLLGKIEDVIKEKGYLKEDGSTDLDGISEDDVLCSIKKALPLAERK